VIIPKTISAQNAGLNGTKSQMNDEDGESINTTANLEYSLLLIVHSA
jgi:hypothetical protein